MDNHILINYGIIRTFHNDQKSIIETLLPFVEYGLFKILENNKMYYDKSSLKELIYQDTGILINDITLGNLLKILEKKQIVTLYEQTQLFQVVNPSELNVKHYFKTVDAFQRDVNEFIYEYKKMFNLQCLDDEVKDTLYSFIESKHNVENKEKLAKINSCFIEYIEYIKSYNNHLYQTFCDINFGYTLSSLLSQESSIEKIKLKDVVIYLDSNFILRLLDLQEECYSKETKELFELLKNSGVRLRIFKETVEEVINVLSFKRDTYCYKIDILSKIVDATNVDSIIGAFLRKKLDVNDVEHIIDTLPETIKKLKIETDSIARYNMSVEDEKIEELLNLKYNDETETRSNFYKKKCKNYISTIKIIQYLRGVSKETATCLANCKYLFLTCDWKLYTYNRSHKDSAYPEIITQELLVDNLMLFFPKNYSKLSLELIISLYHSSRYLDANCLDNLPQQIQKITEQDPELSRYVIMATKNAENYNVINSIYHEEEEKQLQAIKRLALKEQQYELEKEKEHKVNLETKNVEVDY